MRWRTRIMRLGVLAGIAGVFWLSTSGLVNGNAPGARQNWK